MTDKRQSDALRLADELEDSLESHDGSSLTARCQGIADDAAAELRSQYAELETLRAGYAAARLEVESLKAQQPGAVYAELPEPITYQIAVLKACEHGDALVGWRVEPSRQSFDASMRPKRKLYTEGNMHDFADRTHALRVSHWQAPAQPAPAAEWQDISTAPNDGRTLLLGYFNSAGNWRTLRGRWVSEDYISAFWKEPENGEPGWYECAVEADNEPNCWATDPTHWMPLPSPPARKG